MERPKRDQRETSYRPERDLRKTYTSMNQMHKEMDNISIANVAKNCVIFRFLFDILVFFRLYERPLSSKECKMFPWKCLFSISDTNWSKNNFDDLYFVKVIFEEISSWKYFRINFLLTFSSFVAFIWPLKCFTHQMWVFWIDISMFIELWNVHENLKKFSITFKTTKFAP